jgi:hypothetical protein
MHRLLLGVSNDVQVDHVNGDRLDNRRANLRPATSSENMCNRKGSASFKGVHWDKRNKKWRVSIQVKRKIVRLGRFTDPIEAARAYDEAATVHHGEFAVLNFPRTGAT